nr:zinc finger protein 180-like [Bactrocera oleae]
MQLDEKETLNFRKCGEIKTSWVEGKERFYLICDFCDYIVLQLDIFEIHVNTKHKDVHKINYSEEIEDPLEARSYTDDEISISTTDICVQKIPIEGDDYLESDCTECTVELVSKDQNADTFDEDKNKLLTSALIAEYERHRLLWDSKDALAKNRKKREEALKDIAINVNHACQSNFDWKMISSQIRKMRCEIRSALLSQPFSESKRKIHNRPWYFDKVTFLHATIKYKNRRKRVPKIVSNEKPVLPFSDLTDEQNLDLIQIYSSFPNLWDVQHINYRFRNRRQESIMNMQDTLKANIGLSFSLDELQKRIYGIRHSCIQEKRRQLQCDLTNEPFKPICKYYNNIKFLEDNVGPFKCNVCEEILNGYDRYRIHLSAHTGSMPFTCPMCNHGFLTVGNFTVHLRRHTREFEFECDVCKKRYATSTDLNVHMRNHTGEKPYCCEVCGQSYRRWSFFDTHMRRHQKRPNYKCNMCSKTFYEKRKLNVHMKAHLNVRDKICNVCGKAFTSTKYLHQHKQIHSKEKKYKCKICGKNFAQYAGLSGHMKSHGTSLVSTIRNGAEGLNDLSGNKDYG